VQSDSAGTVFGFGQEIAILWTAGQAAPSHRVRRCAGCRVSWPCWCSSESFGQRSSPSGFSWTYECAITATTARLLFPVWMAQPVSSCYDRGGMTGSAAIRVVLAAYLALWTPAWCCCAIRSSLGAITGVAAATCGAAACGSSSAKNRSGQATEEHSCCNSEDGQSSTDQSSDEPCRCPSMNSDQSRFDTSAKLLLPPMSLAFLVVPSPVVAFAHRPGHDFALPVSSQLDLPPPTSLLAQHCLLII
jgi:hypothetical protein